MLSNATALALHRTLLRLHNAHLDLVDRPDAFARQRAYDAALRDAHGLIEQLAPDGRTQRDPISAPAPAATPLTVVNSDR